MKTVVKLLILFPFIFISCNGNTNTLRQKSPEELKAELKLREHSNFNNYLSVQYKLDYKLFADEYAITGAVNNSASVARFKDAILTVTFYSGTDTQLKSLDFIIYKFFEPNSKTAYEIRTKAPGSTKKIGVTIKSVTPID
jgi:hypothetical protein